MKFAGSIISVGIASFWLAVTEYWEEFRKILNEINPFILPIGLFSPMILAVIVFFYEYRRRRDDDAHTKDICQKIHDELKDSIESLDGTLNRHTRQHEINGKKIIYKHIYMNHKIFDGYVNSGEFNKINRILHQSLQDIYEKIKIHDRLVEKCESDPVDDNDVLNLNKYEKELLTEIPTIMGNLKKYL